MSSYFKGKTFLVTGAGQGIGNGICKRLYLLGSQVIAVNKNEKKLDILKKECPGTHTIQADLADWEKTREALKDVEQLDGLVNVAGVTVVKPFGQFTEEDFDFVFDVNIKGLFHVTQLLSPKIKTGGSVVNMSSFASKRVLEGHAVYSASKAAVDSLTKSLALEFSSRKIRVNAVNPTVIMTQMGQKVWSDPAKSGPLLQRIPLQRFGEVDEVVDAVIFFLSDRSSYVNGHTLPLEGGFSVA